MKRNTHRTANMMAQDERLLETIYGVIVLLLAIFTVVSYRYAYQNDSFDGRDFVRLSKGWVQVLPGTEKVIESLPADLDDKLGEAVTIRRILPEEFPIESPALFVKSAHQNVSIRIGGREYYRYTFRASHRYDEGFPPSHWLVVRLSEDCEGQEISITFTRLQDDWTDTVDEIYLGAKADILYELIRQNALPLVVTLLLLLLAAAFLIRQAMVSARREGGHRNLYLALYLAFLAAFLICNSGVRQLYFGNILYARSMEFLSIMMIPVPLILFLNQAERGRFQTAANLLCLLIFAVDLPVLLLALLGISNLLNMLWAIMLTVLAAALFVVISLCRIAVTDPEQFRALTALAISNFLLIVCSAVSFLDIVFLSSRHKDVWLSVGILCHAAGMTVEQLRSQRRLQDTVRRAEMESRAKSDFLANMSHEIRTPINAVLGMDEMILREAEDPRVLEYAADIRRAGKNLLSIINDILDISKIESGRLEITEESYELSALLTDVAELTQVLADEKNLRFVRWIDEQMPNRLCGDAGRIRQIAVNLLNNAVKYTEAGSVTFSVDMIPEVEAHALAQSAVIRGTPTDAASPVFLRMTVRDTGIGIQEKDFPNLFQSFQRLDQKKNAGIQGTGLGLSIVSMLVREMHGCLLVNSVYGTGSEFTVVLPQKKLSDEPIGVLAKRRGEQPGGGGGALFRAPTASVLAVDDNAMNRRLLEAMLRRTEIRVTTCESGQECLNLVRGNRYDLILMDHLMPEMDGIEALERMRAMEDNRSAGAPVIVLTANAIAGVKEQYLAAGFTDYMSKPIQSVELERMLMRYLPAEKLSAPAEGSAAPAAAEKETLPAWLEELEELDTADGLERCGDARTYLEALRVYAETAAASADEIEKYWNGGDVRNAVVKIHALKSTSRAVGAAALGGFAERLENAGHAGETAVLTENVGELLRRYRALGERLAPLRKDDAADADAPEIPAERLREAYGELRERLEEFDIDGASAMLDTLSAYRIPQEERERFEAMRAAARDFEWDQLAKLL